MKTCQRENGEWALLINSTPVSIPRNGTAICAFVETKRIRSDPSRKTVG